MQAVDLRHVYVIVRDDLEPRHKAVQATHAGIQAGRGLIPQDAAHPNLVLLTVPNRFALIAASVSLNKQGITHEVFYEADMDYEPTALATEPISGDTRQVLADYPLLT